MTQGICKRCKEETDELRILWMKCFYAMEELQIPLEKKSITEGSVHDAHPNISHKFYTIDVCKRCRADWMDFIKMWYEIRLDKYDAKGSGIFIRHFGANIEVSEEKFREMYPGIEPTRVIDND